MRFLERFRANRQEQESQSQGTDWDSLKEVKFKDGKVAKKSESTVRLEEDLEKTQILESETEERPKLETYSLAEQKRIMERVKIEGDVYVDERGARQLTVDKLVENDLVPLYKANVEGVEIGLSKSFNYHGRDVICGFVPTKEGPKARTYYRSKSSGMWRYMPDYVSDGKGIKWYGKGYSEESLNLPSNIQEKCNAIIHEQRASVVDSDLAFAGTAARYASKEEYGQALRSGQARGDYYREVSGRPSVVFSNKCAMGEGVPEEVCPNSPGQMPDFRQSAGKYKIDSGIYGELTGTVVVSKDLSLVYTMMKDKQDRAFVGCVEASAPVTSTGVRSKWVYGGDLTTPLYEYKSQAGRFGDTSDTKGNYVCMWRNFLSKTPLVKGFLRSRL